MNQIELIPKPKITIMNRLFFTKTHLDLGHLASQSPIFKHPKEVFSITQPSNPKMEYEITKRLLPLAITHGL
jgi:hypothetical protein